MKKLVIPLAIFAMLLLLGAAFAWDSVRYAADARGRVALADEELKKHEARFVKLLAESSQTTAEVQAAVDIYKSASSEKTRHEAYEELVASFRKTMADKVDPTNPLDRKFMDDISGAINRREIAEQAYDNESAAYQQILSGFRGRIAKMFSSPARADDD